ncbi:nicotinate-nucleotide--dimethylbenzimidazole phosphoribosyltransferase [Aquihabitans daechungensis]|uniref:nicotinate-nucleotide--dimethylbenzimidazole phosphoribosyltransferase n=1 Tax=Aquihabitans daechungensis TaxID=1052257 RepID=UPI003BA14790
MADQPTSPFDLPSIAPLDDTAAEAARARWATRAKPPGSLGQLEDVAISLAAITGTCPPPVVARPAVVVFAADHGVVADGASAWPSDITGLMVHAMAGGVAAINTFATTVGAEVALVDVGVAGDLTHLPGVRHRKVRPGTASLAHGPAMTAAEAAAAVTVGIDLANELIATGVDCLVAGDMGIGNTTPSAILIGILAGALPDTVTGTGAGLPADQLGHKTALVAAAMDRAAGTTDPLALLAEVGGLEIAAMAGLYLGAAAARVPFIIDGVIAASAACVADALVPGAASHGLAGHLSTEPAATVALKHLGLEPLLDLRLRLGEGTGACLAIPLVQAAARALTDMADLPEA